MKTLDIKTAKVFAPLYQKARYKGAYGGRGSGKSHFFAEALVAQCLAKPKTRAVCIREVQRSLKESSKTVIEAKILSLDVGKHFEVMHDRIITPGGGVILFSGMQDHTAESIKSLEACRLAWCEEAQSMSQRSLSLLRPTIRAENSEIWFSWNPTRKSDAVDRFLRQSNVDDAVVIKATYADNPWFPQVLAAERERDLRMYPDRYPHIWEGEYAKALEGAYFAAQLNECKREGRIGHVAPDPLLPYRAYFDLGGAGAEADAMAIWIVQFVGRQILVLDYFEGVGQVLAYYVNLLRQRGYQNAKIFLPHDGLNTNPVTGKTYADHLRDAEFDVADPLKNLGRGYEMLRIEAVRRLFPQMWFNEETTEAGRDALGYYHERRDETRNIGLGAEHDWSSHAADAFGLMAVSYEAPARQRRPPDRPYAGEQSWMS
jgi:phage terminase large subunit